MKRWWILGLLAAVFVVLGAVLAVALRGDGLPGVAAGAVFLLVGLGMAWSAAQMRREESMGEVGAPEAVPGGVPWPEVAERIRARFQGTPYAVEVEGSIVRVRADLADATFLTWAAAHHVNEVRGVEVVAPRPGQAITRDFSQGFEIDAGAGRLTGSAHVESGRSWSYTRRIEYGVGTDGSVGRQVDIDFGSSEIQGPVNEVLRETGWYTTWFAALPAEAKGGLVMGAVGGIGGLVAAVAVLVDALS
jgi:hypothetical protein